MGNIFVGLSANIVSRGCTACPLYSIRSSEIDRRSEAAPGTATRKYYTTIGKRILVEGKTSTEACPTLLRPPSGDNDHFLENQGVPLNCGEGAWVTRA